jgi:dTDP-4-dehydrorhamnose 3,5-epimerase
VGLRDRALEDLGLTVEVLPTELPEVKVLVQTRHVDDRGWFARAWCARELAEAGLDARLAQVNLSASTRRGTVRGLHLQRAPHAETKLVHVLRGAILDVAVDLREGSPTWGRHVACELSADDGRGLLVPMGYAHGFQALTDDVLMVYLMSEHHSPADEVGVAHDDPTLAIPWPLPVSAISARDAALPTLQERS